MPTGDAPQLPPHDRSLRLAHRVEAAASQLDKAAQQLAQAKEYARVAALLNEAARLRLEAARQSASQCAARARGVGVWIVRGHGKRVVITYEFDAEHKHLKPKGSKTSPADRRAWKFRP